MTATVNGDRSFRGVTLITGASSGIGRALYTSLSNRSIACIGTFCTRTPKKPSFSMSSSDLVCLDLTDAQSISALCNLLREQGVFVRSLINNAGVSNGREKFVAAGSKNWQINVVGPFKLASTLLSRGLLRPGAQILNIASNVYSKNIDPIFVSARGCDFGTVESYMQSKLCCILVSRYLSQIWHRRFGVFMNVMHPGTVRSNLGATNWLRKTVVVGAGFFLPPPGAAASNISTVINYVNDLRVFGHYFEKSKICTPRYDGELELDAKFILSQFPHYIQEVTA
jgi:NAD(P)-dependent dehydrogenase (short-subunit alcohol dehydrogenase family)